jgi:hypothetical protein
MVYCLETDKKPISSEGKPNVRERNRDSMRYMISFTFVPGHQAEIAALIPDEQAHVKRLRENGTIEALYLSADGPSSGWLVIKSESKEDAQRALETFPLYPHMIPEIAALR